MRKYCSSLCRFAIFVLLTTVNCPADAADCNCGDYCSTCGNDTPIYISATLSSLQGCPDDFQEGVAQVYPCFGDKMDIVCKQDPEYSCGYFYNGPVFNVEGESFDFRLVFYLNLAAPDGKTEFSVITQENCGGWYDLTWSTTSTESSCSKSGSCEFTSLCNVPFPDIASGNVSWRPAYLADGNCPGCGEANEIPENCDDLTCDTLNQYTFFDGPAAYYYGPFLVYSPSKCEKTAKAGNSIQTAKIVCPGAQLVSASARSSAPDDIIVSPQNADCSPGSTANFSITALRGKGQVTLTATFYQKTYSNECIAQKTTKTVTILVQPDPGDECCSDESKPILLKGSPGNVSTPIRAGANPLDEWPQAVIYRDDELTDIAVILPGRFTPIIFNNGKAPDYMRGWKAQTDESNAVIITNPENIKYIYEQDNEHKIHFIKNAQDQNIVEFIYDGNGLPFRQNDLTDTNLYISYHYNNNLLAEIREHAGENYRQFLLEYDNDKVSLVSGQCSQCSSGGRKYFYNSDGTILYEKSIDNEIIYEYAFDSEQRLTDKWLGAKQSNHPIKIIDYTDSNDGYIADIKDYVDDVNFRPSREYRTKADILTKRITCEQFNENLDCPAGRTFTENYIYDVNDSTNLVNKLTLIEPKTGSAKTEFLFDANCGEILRKIVYDINNNPEIILENTYEYLDSNGVATNTADEIFIARLVKSRDIYDSNTFYQYDDTSNYPAGILLPNDQKQEFIYDAEKQVIRHTYIDNNSTRLLSQIDYDYDDFGNLIGKSYSDANDINDTVEYRYNDFGEIIRIKSAAGVVTGKSYDDFGRLISEFALADANDIELQQPDLIRQKYYSYDSNGLLAYESVAVDTGRFAYNCPAEHIYTTYEYDLFGRLIEITEDANGEALRTTFEYNRQDEIVKVTRPGGKWSEYIYDGRGMAVNEITGFGSDEILVTEYEYDENANCTRQTDSDGTTSLLEYDEFDRIKIHSLPNNSDVVYQYNSAGQVVCQTLFDANQTVLQQTVFDYDTTGRCRLIRQRQTAGQNNDTNDFVTLYTFDCIDNVIQKTIKADSQTNDIITRYEFDGKNRITKIIDALSNAEKFTYNKDNNIKSVTNSLNLITVNTFDSLGRIIKTQTPNGNYKTFVYDSLDRCIKETLFDFNDSPTEQKRYEYCGLENISKIITMYDPANQAPADAAVDNIIAYDYNDLSGLPESRTSYYDENKQAVELYEYDNIGRLAAITDAAGNRTDILYDSNFPGRINRQILTLTDGNEQLAVTTYLEYDDSGRIIESRIDSNLVTHYFYDGADRVTKQVKPGGSEIIYDYDSFDNVVKITQNTNGIVEFEYDRTGRLISVTAYDPNSQKTTFEYDKNAQVTKIIYADGKEEQYKYDALGKITEKTLRNADKIYFGYDAEDNLIWQSDDSDGPAGDVNNAEFLIEFEYNPKGQITYAAKTVNGQIVSQTEFEYNGLGKITKESTSLFELEPVVIEYNYEQSGSITAQITEWSRQDFTHDKLGRIKTIGRNGSGIAEMQYFGSSISKRKFLEPDIEYTVDFDSIGRINHCKSLGGDDSILDFIYSYDNASRRFKCTYNHIANSPSDEYEYDVSGRITKAEYAGEQFEEFSYDPLGNRISVQTKEGFTETYYHNNLNQYTAIYDSNICWDDNGGLSYEESDSLEYEYDRLGNLTKVKLNSQPIVQFVYDALGRRIRKTTADADTIYYYDISNRVAAEYEINQTGESVFSAEYIYGNGFSDIIARFLYEKPYDGNTVSKLAEFCQTYLYGTGQQEFNSDYDYDSSGWVDLQDFAVFADENIVSLPEMDANETHWYYLKDIIGSTYAVVGGKFNRPNEREFFSYDVFGKPAQTGTTGCDYLFAGYRYDGEIDKYYCTNRYYDATIGSFLSMDPLLFADGFNAYEYAENNPVMFTDSLGLKSSFIEELEFLIGRGKIRTAAKRLTQEVKKTCEKLDSDCRSRKCIGSIINPNCKKAEKCFELYRKALEYDRKLNTESAKVAAIGTLAGTAQGILNTANGLQDIAVSVTNLGFGIWNYTGALICDKELEYINSPDWSEDLIVDESPTAHSVSKFLGSEGALTLATVGVSQWRNAQLVNKMQKTGSAALKTQEGIYEFTASSGKTYVGQSSNIPRRITEHINSGKMLAENIQTLKTTEVSGGRIAREIAEQARIDRLGGIKNLENAKNVIGPARSYLLQK